MTSSCWGGVAGKQILGRTVTVAAAVTVAVHAPKIMSKIALCNESI